MRLQCKYQLISCTIALLLLACDRPTPQSVASVQDGDTENASCRTECEIALQRVVSIRNSADPFDLTDRPNIQRAASGRYYVTRPDRLGYSVYDSTGMLIKTLGRKGRGPGEFEFLVGLALQGNDTLYAYEGMSRRLTVFAKDSAVVRTLPNVPAPPSLVFPDGSFLIAAQVPTSQQIGWPLHRVNAEGAFVRSFGGDGPQFRPDLSRVLTRVVGNGIGATYWAAAPGRYRLEHWDARGDTLLRSVDVRSAWFEPSDGPPRGSYRHTRPTPVITSVWAMDEKSVWVLLATADKDWKQLESDINAPDRPGDPEVRARSFDYVLEVIDVPSGEVVASLRMDLPHFSLPPSNLLVSQTETSSADVTLDVWQPILQQRSR